MTNLTETADMMDALAFLPASDLPHFFQCGLLSVHSTAQQEQQYERETSACYHHPKAEEDISL